ARRSSAYQTQCAFGMAASIQTERRDQCCMILVGPEVSRIQREGLVGEPVRLEHLRCQFGWLFVQSVKVMQINSVHPRRINVRVPYERLADELRDTHDR